MHKYRDLCGIVIICVVMICEFCVIYLVSVILNSFYCSKKKEKKKIQWVLRYNFFMVILMQK